MVQYSVALIYGTALFYVYRFFPVTSFLLSLLLLALLTTPKSIRRRLLSFSVILIMVLLGFSSAYMRTVPQAPVSAIAGQTIAIKGTVRSGPVPLHSHPGSFSHIIDISEAVDNRGNHLSLREIRVMGDSVMTPGMPYLITVHVPPDAYFMNPGSRSVLAGYALGIVPVDNSSAKVWAR